jgi:eukaryotic-like serine/threonine-protein kinase
MAAVDRRVLRYRRAMGIALGTRLGPYEIIAPLGVGGMGEVYRARDRRLGRDVAVKVLPSQLAHDPERRRRFELEARAAGALNHPSVIAVFDVDAQGSTAYLVTELLEGETVRNRLAAGAPPIREAIQWAVQIAEGLAAAHDKGIVHRDVKPENLFVTRDGRLKILDFGLAKAGAGGGAAPGSGSDSTLPADSTESGVVLGTVGYMAPEQVMAKSVDARSDLFAFGAVLYELLTGRRAFGEGSPVERAYAILKDEPPLASESNPDVSPALEGIVRRCLQKRPEDRFQSARDLAFHLATLSSGSGASTRAPVVNSIPRRRLPRAAVVVATFAAAVITGIPAYVVGRREGDRALVPNPSVPTLAATSPEPPRYSRLTFRRSVTTNARFSPDGRSILYSARFDGQDPQLLNVLPGQPDSRVLGDNLFLFGVSARGELAVGIPSSSPLGPLTLGRVALGASVPRAVLEGVTLADWAPDGNNFAVAIDDRVEQRLEYPIGHVLARVAGEIGALRISPDGQLVAFVHWQNLGDDRGTVDVVDARGARRTVAGPYYSVRGLAWSADGRELWFAASPKPGSNGMSIRAATLDGQDRMVSTLPLRAMLLDRAADGRLLVYLHIAIRSAIEFHRLGVPGSRELSWFDGSGVADVSADGQTLLFSEGREAAASSEELMIYTRPTSGGPAVPLGVGAPYALSPDGKWILAAQHMPRFALELLPTGAGQPRVITRGHIAEYGDFGGFFPDGKRIWFLARDRDVPRLWVQDLTGGEPRALTDRAVFSIARALSPDGKTFLLGDPSDGSFFELDAAGGAPRPQAFPAGASPVGWTSDGGIYLVRQPPAVPTWTVTRWDRATGREHTMSTFRKDTCPSPSGKRPLPIDPAGLIAGGSDFLFSPDGSWYTVDYGEIENDLFVIEGLE